VADELATGDVALLRDNLLLTLCSYSVLGQQVTSSAKFDVTSPVFIFALMRLFLNR
jgi:hypothetical protein